MYCLSFKHTGSWILKHLTDACIYPAMEYVTLWDRLLSSPCLNFNWLLSLYPNFSALLLLISYPYYFVSGSDLVWSSSSFYLSYWFLPIHQPQHPYLQTRVYNLKWSIMFSLSPLITVSLESSLAPNTSNSNYSNWWHFHTTSALPPRSPFLFYLPLFITLLELGSETLRPLSYAKLFVGKVLMFLLMLKKKCIISINSYQ